MSLIDTVYASEGVTAGAPGGLLDSFGLDPRLFLLQLANFIIVAIILWFLILKPLTKKLSERQKVIEDSLENAKKVAETLARSEAQYQKRLREARQEAEKILAQAGVDAASLSEEMKAKVKKEIEVLVAQAKYFVQAEKEEMMAAFKKEAAQVVGKALEKLIGEKMTAEKDKELIADIIGKLKTEQYE